MVFEAGYRRAGELRKALRKAQWEALVLRFQLAKLPSPDPIEFYDNRPTTRSGWAKFSALLAHENLLNETAQTEIKLGLESIDIREKEADIRQRIVKGESLHDQASSSALTEVPPDSLLKAGTMSIIRWAAIKELGLDANGFYDSVQRRAAEEAAAEKYRIAKARGDFRVFWENVRPAKPKSSAAKQEPSIPSGFVATELTIPISAFKDSAGLCSFIRYHPTHGLVQGSILSSSYYDRGAGNSPGARGKRVTQFYPVIRSFLEAVNLKKLNTLAKKSTMRILESTGAVVGLEKTGASLVAEMHVNDRFWSQEEVEKFLKGDIESIFVSRTLPVEITRVGDAFNLRFHARSLK